MFRIACLLAVCLIFGACKGNPGNPNAPSPGGGQNVTFATTDLRVGTGTEATNGRVVSTNYTLWLYSATGTDNKGQQLQTSVGGQPLTFTVGAGQVITGYDRGVLGMRVGGTRRVIVPSNLAYGATGNGPIPPNAAIVFEIELLSAQ